MRCYIVENREIEAKGVEDIAFVFDITNRLIPLLIDGAGNVKSYEGITSLLHNMLDFDAVAFCIGDNIIVQSGDIEIDSRNRLKLNHISINIEKDRAVIGTLKLYRASNDRITHREKAIVEGIGKFISTQVTFNREDYYSSLRSKAELKALQAQINPHFLFNALNTISSMCRTEPMTARKLLIHLSNYFRATIETSPDLVDIHKELSTIFYYLEIEKARFGDRFHVDIDIPMDLSIMVPPLILQPLVENSIKHGFSDNIDKKGRILIRVEAYRDHYEVSVEDNGKGMPEEIIDKVLNGGFGNDRIGLYNVDQRLREVYGKENGLIIDSSLGEGTKITFKIPIRERSGRDGLKSYYSR